MGAQAPKSPLESRVSKIRTSQVQTPLCFTLDAEIPRRSCEPFLEYYGRYLVAKSQAESEMIWLSAVVCRAELRKCSAEEAQYCEKHIQGIHEPETSSPNILRSWQRQQILIASSRESDCQVSASNSIKLPRTVCCADVDLIGNKAELFQVPAARRATFE